MSSTLSASSTIAPLNVSERQNRENRHREQNHSSMPLNKTQISKLMEQGFTRGLAHSLSDTKRSFPLRYWIIDNSGSMVKRDGHRIVLPETHSGSVRTQSCSRWDELADCVKYHIGLAALLEAPTIFRFLNKYSPKNSATTMTPTEFSVAQQRDTIERDSTRALSYIDNARACGGTPLSARVQELREEIKEIAPTLTAKGQRVAITIATDGLPTDTDKQGFVDTLRLLEGLPVWVVIRLCTDEDNVVDFYNDLDEQLELSIEVLDDFHGEAIEVTAENPWVNYTLQLHRLREFGYHHRVFDLLDERPLTKSDIRDYCQLLFSIKKGDLIGQVPDPSLDWKGFVTCVEVLVERESQQWNPIHKRKTPWVLVKHLKTSWKLRRMQVIRQQFTSMFRVK